MVTMNLGKPGFYDQMANRMKTEELQRRHGAGLASNGDALMMAGAARDQGFGAQYDALNMFRDQAMGTGGPSAAQIAWQQQAQQNATNSLALAARGRGGNITGAGQQALASNVYANQQTNAGLAQLRAQEQAAGQASYAGLAGQMVGQGFGYDQMNTQAQLQADQNTLGWYGAERGMDMQQDQFSHQKMMDRFNMGMQAAKTVAGAVGGAMGGGMMSDERAKTGIRPTSLAASRAVGDITPAVYNYKPGAGPGGERIGPMAQDLEQNPYTASLVQEGPDGLKRVDVGGLAALATSATAEHEGRLRQLESMVSDERMKENIVPTIPPMQPRGPEPYWQVGDRSFDDRMQQARASMPPRGSRVASYDNPQAPIGGPRYGAPGESPGARGIAAMRTIDPFTPTPMPSGSMDVKEGGSSLAHAAATKGVPGPYVPNEERGGSEDERTWANFAGAIDKMGGGPMVTPVGQQMTSDERAKKNVRHTTSAQQFYGKGGQLTEPVTRRGETLRMDTSNYAFDPHTGKATRLGLSPEAQTRDDYAQDIVDRHTEMDELGRRRLRARPLAETSAMFYPRGERRYDAEQRQQQSAAIDQEVARLEAQAAAIRKQYGLNPPRTI